MTAEFFTDGFEAFHAPNFIDIFVVLSLLSIHNGVASSISLICLHRAMIFNMRIGSTQDDVL